MLASNSQKMASKEREVQDYASRLAVMRSNRKSSSSSAGKPMLETEDSGAKVKIKIDEQSMINISAKVRGERMVMLRKQLDETKARQEAEFRSRRELESIVTGLQRELEERAAPT